MSKVIRREISVEAIERLRELRGIAYKSDKKTLKRRQRRAKCRSGQKRDVSHWTESDIDSLAKGKEKLKAGDAWRSFGERVKNCLIVGDRYIVRHKSVKCKDPSSARSMIFVRIVHNRLGQPLFLFRSCAGYLESFTLQQLRDCTLRGGVGQCELW